MTEKAESDSRKKAHELAYRLSDELQARREKLTVADFVAVARGSMVQPNKTWWGRFRASFLTHFGLMDLWLEFNKCSISERTGEIADISTEICKQRLFQAAREGGIVIPHFKWHHGELLGAENDRKWSEFVATL